MQGNENEDEIYLPFQFARIKSYLRIKIECHLIVLGQVSHASISTLNQETQLCQSTSTKVENKVVPNRITISDVLLHP